MAYKIHLLPSFLKDAKNAKNNKSMYADFLTCIERISENPSIGDALKGSWKGFSSFHFHRKPEMRIIYALYSCCKPIEMEEKESENWVCRYG